MSETKRGPGGMGPIIVFLVVGAVMGLTLAYLPRRSSSTRPSRPLAVGTLAPDFTLHDAQKSDGDDPVILSRLIEKGPVVVIFNMGLHCAACAANMAEFAAHAAEFKTAGIQVVSVSIEPRTDTRMLLENWPTVTFPLLEDPDNKVARAYGLETPDGMLERTFLIDKNRRVQLIEKPDERGAEIPELLKVGSKSQSPR